MPLFTQYNCHLQELVTSLERSRDSLTNDLASTSAQVQSLQEELQILPVVQNNLQVSSIKCNNTASNVFLWGV